MNNYLKAGLTAGVIFLSGCYSSARRGAMQDAKHAESDINRLRVSVYHHRTKEPLGELLSRQKVERLENDISFLIQNAETDIDGRIKKIREDRRQNKIMIRVYDKSVNDNNPNKFKYRRMSAKLKKRNIDYDTEIAELRDIFERLTDKKYQEGPETICWFEKIYKGPATRCFFGGKVKEKPIPILPFLDD